MQGAATAPAPPAAEPPASQQIKTEVISEAKIDMENHKEEDTMRLEKNEVRVMRTTSIDSDNRSDRSEEDDTRRSRKRAASTSPTPIPMDKRTARFECQKCHQRFDSANAFDLHRFTAHGDDTRTGFDDLTFVDFSSKKFPEIARGVCERNPHISITEQRFRCDLCSRDFPCGQALDIHKRSCANTTRIQSPERDRREDFFKQLDLRNRSFGIPGTLTPPMDRFTPKFDDSHLPKNGIRHIDAARDLADIQSILNVTSAGSLLERLTGTRVSMESAVLTPPDTIVKERDQEETQDNFAAEFRKMKLRGEFPCRLCPAKFPNLRALKGHNRVHLSGTGPGPYQCNMCPHASLDKAALVRHMRTHNGDRPYECAVCNYAFTTKANCERHLRNRHAKVTREDVKRSIIYHPSEDPNNDEVNSKLAREEVKRSLAFHTPPEIERRNEVTGRDTPLTHFAPSFIGDRHPVASLTSKPLQEVPLSLTPRDNDQPMPKIKVRGIAQLTQIPEFRTPDLNFKNNDTQVESYDEETPVDLSTSDNNSCDVLDLSKKKRDIEDDEPKAPRPSFEPDPAAAASAFEKTRFLLTQQRLFESNFPKIDAFYATQLSQLYAGAVPGLPGLPLPPSFPLNPYFLPPSFFPNATDSQELAEIKQRIQKELIRGLSMSGGRLITNDQEIQPKQEPEEEEQKPIALASSPSPTPHSESPRPVAHNNLVPQTDSVKMVIKNGVLMPKQKQRRYRTERPFSCSQCSARFTLRSNMERHVKQQHPQHWSVRRPPPRAPPPYPTPDTLADRVKFALLARHLERPLQQPERSPIRRDSDEVADNEEDEEDALIIDEEPDDEKPEENTAAHRAAAEILMASRQQELNKDFDLKIAGNLINKPTPIPTTTEKTETGTDPIPEANDLAVPVVPTRSDEEEDEEGLVASTSEGNNSGSDENKSDLDNGNQPPKKKSAYSLAPNRVSCPYCHRKFPWSSSLRRHVLTHTGQKPFKCPHCPLLFTTKSNCDRHLLRKHGGSARAILAEPVSETIQTPQNFEVRTVTERPFKCASCPTSTFSSMENLKKHMSCRHGTGEPSQPSSPIPVVEEVVEGLVFKCHLCEASFGDRTASLSHLSSQHVSEYEQLVNKGALDAASDRSESADDDERGKFPDHANRKVVCAFCIRRFWSAEDLRRHMRTHSGERPFACDLCRRRFTLKHSMLRHRKKHREEATDDEEASPPNTPIDADGVTNGYRYQDDDSGNEIPNNINNNNSPPAAPYDKKLKFEMTSRKYSSEAENDGENGSDLIGKLLGIRDNKLLNKLLSSPDEAAKFLGVNK